MTKYSLDMHKGFKQALVTRLRSMFPGLAMMPVPLLLLLSPVDEARAEITFTTLHTFTGVDGQAPEARLVQGADGNFYGTTSLGGAFNYGTVFRVTSQGALTTLHEFDGMVAGLLPQTGLARGLDGDLYGTTTTTSSTIFRITLAGTLTTLHQFDFATEGVNPVGELVQGTDGNFYGTAWDGGAFSNGTVYRITPTGVLTTLHSFAGVDGKSPRGSLVEGPEGNFYGTTKDGGVFGLGTVFKVSPQGSLSTLHSFAGPDGDSPEAGLALGQDGNFYGTTRGGGAHDYGTVFRISPGGVLITLHSLDLGPDGGSPVSELILGADGNFYGTTLSGGGSGGGTVFAITPGGALTKLHAFDFVAEGAAPRAGLVQGADGSFYGTTFIGGANGSGKGTVFKLSGSASGSGGGGGGSLDGIAVLALMLVAASRRCLRNRNKVGVGKV